MEILKYRKDINSPWQDIAAIVGPMGPQGEPGKDGANGIDGKDGLDGKDGYTPVKGVDYFDGEPGKDGKDGQDGYTPIKGVDYFDGKDGEPGPAGKDGEPGEKGEKGDKGEDGVTIVEELPTPSKSITGDIYKYDGKYYVAVESTIWKPIEDGDRIGTKDIWFDISYLEVDRMVKEGIDVGGTIFSSGTLQVGNQAGECYIMYSGNTPRLYFTCYYTSLMGSDGVQSYGASVWGGTENVSSTGDFYGYNFDNCFNNLKVDETHPLAPYVKLPFTSYVWKEVYTGDVAKITIGNVITGEPGTNADVVNAGDEYTAVLNFVIPKGEKGDTGEQGPQGIQGEQGIQGIPGEKGEQGEPGTPGKDGIDGTNGTNGVDGKDGKDGADYILTEADKEEIAAIVLAQMPEGSILPESEEVSF